MTELPERFLAVGAGVRLGPAVDADVLGQVARVGERLGAVRTLVRFGLCVRLGVDLHVRLTEEGRRTHPAPTGGETQKWEAGMEKGEPEGGKQNQRRRKFHKRWDEGGVG